MNHKISACLNITSIQMNHAYSDLSIGVGIKGGRAVPLNPLHCLTAIAVKLDRCDEHFP